MKKKRSHSDISTTAVVGMIAIMTLVIGFIFFNNSPDTVEEDLELNLTNSEAVSNSLGEMSEQNLESTLQESAADSTAQSQTTNFNQSEKIADSNQPARTSETANNINQQTENNTMTDKTNLSQPEMMIDLNKQYFAVINTNQGTIELELFPQETPVTVNNFVYLAQNNFYDDLIFHRVIPNFMIQGGCPLGTGTSGPGYQFEDEQNPAPLVRGSVAMANSGPDTNGSQFFIVTAEATPHLDGLHTHFGKVVAGMDVVTAIEQTPTETNDKPVQDMIIHSIEINES